MLDARELLATVKNETIDLVFLDPPFSLGKNYGIHGCLESLDESEYESAMIEVLHESVRVLKPGGSLFLYHLPRWAMRLGPHVMDQLELRHWIAISMKNGFARGKFLYPAHYALLYLSKGQPRLFERPRHAAASCRHCGGYVKDYGGYTAIIEEKGVNLSDVWDDLSPVRHRANKHRVANELPETLTDRVVHMSGGSGAVLLDPFVGSGTSLVSAARHGMWFVAGDLSSESVSGAEERVRCAIERGV